METSLNPFVKISDSAACVLLETLIVVRSYADSVKIYLSRAKVTLGMK